MATRVTEQLLYDMAQAIVQEVDPEAIYVFGSQARGDASEQSDVDLLVIEREPFGPGRSRLQELWRIRRALSSFRVPKDILLYSTDEVDKWHQSLNHVVGHALREGKQLYGDNRHAASRGA